MPRSIALMFALLISLLARATHALPDVSGFADLEGANGGTTIFNSLTLPPAAGALARNPIALPWAFDATDAPLFASSTAHLMRHEFAAGHLEWFSGLRDEYLGASIPFIAIGTASLYGRVFSATQFGHSRDIDEKPTNPKAAEITLGGSFAHQFIYDRLSAGLGLQYVESRLDNEAARSISVSVDALVTPIPWMRTGLYMRNLGPDASYSGIVKEPQPLLAGLAFTFSPFQPRDTTPRAITLDVGIGAQKQVDAPLKTAIGLDFKPHPNLSIKCGWNYSIGSDPGIAGLSAGAGLSIRQWGVDAGWKFVHRDLGHAFGINLRYNTEEIIPKTAEDHYRAAEMFYRNERYRLCIDYARRALRLNPDLWKAHALMTKAIAELNRDRGTEVALLFSGNVKGNLLPIDVGGASMGGLARQATIIRQTRSDYRSSVIIDAGNMVTAQTPRDKARLADRFERELDYDLLAIGSGEIAYGFAKYALEAKQSSIRHICSSPVAGLGEAANYRIVNIGRYRAAIFAVVPEGTGNALSLGASVSAVQSLLSDPAIAACEIKVLIADDTWENIRTYATRCEGLSAIVTTGVEQKFETPMKEGSVIITSAGTSGGYMTALYARFTPQGSLATLRGACIPLDGTVSPDPSIESLARKVTVGTDMAAAGMPKEFLKEGKIHGVFPFISTRHGEPQAYLYLPEKHLEIPLSNQHPWCGEPVVAWNSGYLALRAGTSKDSASVRIVDMAGLDEKEIPFGGAVTSFTLSPDEAWIYAAVRTGEKRTALMRVQTTGGEPQTLFSWKGSQKAPIFTPDGRTLLFVSDRDGNDNIYQSDLTGQMPLRLTDAGINMQPRMSPDGKTIAFMSNRENFRDRLDIWLHDVSTGAEKRLTRNASIQDFLWMSNGTILYSAGSDNAELSTIETVNGTQKHLLTPGVIKTWQETDPQRCTTEDNHDAVMYTRTYKDGRKEIRRFDLQTETDEPATSAAGNNSLR